MLAAALLLTGCADLMETDSELVEYEKDNHLDSPSDSVYSVMGIIYKLQTIADRTVIAGKHYYEDRFVVHINPSFLCLFHILSQIAQKHKYYTIIIIKCQC